jgi:hypothetical protein
MAPELPNHSATNLVAHFDRGGGRCGKLVSDGNHFFRVVPCEAAQNTGELTRKPYSFRLVLSTTGSDFPKWENQELNMKSLQSKKLLAYLVAEATWKILLGITLWLHPEEGAVPRWALITMIVTAGFLEVGYILGQAYVDRFITATRIGRRDEDDKPTQP